MKRWIAFIAAGILAGCGTLPEDRAVSGAGIGASAGAVLGAVTGMSVLTGAAIGAAAGALTGVVTDRDQINLGEPAWKQGAAGAAGAALVRRVQEGLERLGYRPGPADGIAGERTRAAVRAYQRDHGLLVDGRITPELADHISARAG
jgi:peptidoglycan hydrolase-like protein with peptidoglycan-binding domain